MGSDHQLPVLMPSLPNQRWSCQSCALCCRTLVGHLTPRERVRIDEQNWEQELGVPPYVKLGRSWALNKHPDGACVFLGADGLCLIHARYGEAAKPLACRIYPFSVRPVPHGWRASLRFCCPSVQRSQGKPIADYRTWLTDLARALPHRVPAKEDGADWIPRVPATVEELDKLTNQLGRWCKKQEYPLGHRLSGAARLTEALEETPFKKLRGHELEEVIELLLKALPAEAQLPAEPPSGRLRGMLRQLAFAHAEHLSHREMRRFWRRLNKRRQQLRAARLFRRGVGRAPVLPGYKRTPEFAAVEAVLPAGDAVESVEEMVTRYLLTRLEGRTVWGAGYYGWPALAGLHALWLSTAAAGWLARYHCASEGRGVLTFEDVGTGLGMVDRAATRLPSLGTVAERMRIQYLTRDDGGAQLLAAYPLDGGSGRFRRRRGPGVAWKVRPGRTLPDRVPLLLSSAGRHPPSRPYSTTAEGASGTHPTVRRAMPIPPSCAWIPPYRSTARLRRTVPPSRGRRHTPRKAAA